MDKHFGKKIDYYQRVSPTKTESLVIGYGRRQPDYRGMQAPNFIKSYFNGRPKIGIKFYDNLLPQTISIYHDRLDGAQIIDFSLMGDGGDTRISKISYFPWQLQNRVEVIYTENNENAIEIDFYASSIPSDIIPIATYKYNEGKLIAITRASDLSDAEIDAVCAPLIEFVRGTIPQPFLDPETSGLGRLSGGPASTPSSPFASMESSDARDN